MIAAWRRYEGPTWLVALAIYGGWIALAIFHARIPLAVAFPLAIYLTAWHSSLQHETIHALRHVPRRLRSLLASPPLGVFFPYEIYRREHLRHHGARELAGPGDPESFYHDPKAWDRMPSSLRMLYRFNTTLAGRLIAGPAISIARTYAGEIRRIVRGDRSRVAIWVRHALALALVALVLRSNGIDPLLYLVAVAYPAASLGFVRSFAEHRYAASPERRTAIVESRGALSLLFLNNNLHAVHHAHPTAPWYELPERYRSYRASDTIVDPDLRLRGYRAVARAWLLRSIDSPVFGSGYERASDDPIARRVVAHAFSARTRR